MGKQQDMLAGAPLPDCPGVSVNISERLILLYDMVTESPGLLKRNPLPRFSRRYLDAGGLFGSNSSFKGVAS
jgi:hypothetical protein